MTNPEVIKQIKSILTVLNNTSITHKSLNEIEILTNKQ